MITPSGADLAKVPASPRKALAHDYRSRRFWVCEAVATGFIALLFLSVSLASVATQVVTTRRASLMPDGFSLPDVHDSMPRLEKGLADLVMYPLLITCILILLLAGGLTHALTYFRRAFIVWQVCMIVRVLTILATQLPDPEGECLASVNWDEINGRSVLHVFWASQVVKSTFTCADMVYSGHTTFGTACLLLFCSAMGSICADARKARKTAAPDAKLPLWAKTPSWALWVSAPIVFGIYVTFIYLIAATRIHFTVDVVVAFFVCSLFIPAAGMALRRAAARYPPGQLFSTPAASNSTSELLSFQRSPAKQPLHAVWADFVRVLVRIALLVVYGGAPVPAEALGEGEIKHFYLPWPDKSADIAALAGAAAAAPTASECDI